MNLADYIRELDEYAQPTEKAKSRKSRVKVFKSIDDALRHTRIGAKWSTKKANRIYVTTKGNKWGKSGQQTVAGRTAKGFTPGSATPSAKWPSIVGHANRVKKKYRGWSSSHDVPGSKKSSKKKSKK
tara:strand:+ start:1037 stop:1417 length:381 start_codon:yes stop_codon:yes gene_type:complete